MAYGHAHLSWSRLVHGAGGVVLADLILGMAAFSAITLGSLWMFSVGWLVLVQEYAARGVAFGSDGQTMLAWLGVVVTIPALIATVYLAVVAFRWPRGLLRGAWRPAP